jgi:hypothetical protein
LRPPTWPEVAGEIILQTLGFPKELGRCHGIPLIFLDTNVLIDAEDFVEGLFQKQGVWILKGVLCDFIEGEARNLRKGREILEKLKLPEFSGYYFETSYNSKEGSGKALEDLPTGEMKEAVLVEYDRKLDPTGMHATSKDAKNAARSKSRFTDFSLMTVAALAAYRRKRQSVIVSRDRWIKLSCKALEEKFQLSLYCYDQWNFSVEEILARSRNELVLKKR